MKYRAENRLGGTWFVRTTIIAVLMAGSLSSRFALAAPANLDPLRLKMTMASGAHVSVGEPIVVHYTIKNTAAVGQITFHSGEKNNEWYTFSLTDAGGRTIKAVPPPTLGQTQGTHPTSEASIPNGDRIEGDLVVTQYLSIPGPGAYTLTIHAVTPYYVEPEGAWYPEGRPNDIQQVNLTQDFHFPLTVTVASRAALRATAEGLRRKLLDVRYAGQWESLTGQLFSMPEATVLPIWQGLLTDSQTDDLVLRSATNLLAAQPSAAHADLVALALWDGAVPRDTFNHPWVSRTLFKMYETADSPLKQHIRSLYLAHGVSDPHVLETTNSRPN